NDPTYGYSYNLSYSYTSPTYNSVPTGVTAYWGPSLLSYPVSSYTASNDQTVSSSYGYCSFLLNATVFDKSLSLAKITDGTSNSVFVAEGYSSCSSYGYTDPPT